MPPPRQPEILTAARCTRAAHSDNNCCAIRGDAPRFVGTLRVSWGRCAFRGDAARFLGTLRDSWGRCAIRGEPRPADGPCGFSGLVALAGLGPGRPWPVFVFVRLVPRPHPPPPPPRRGGPRRSRPARKDPDRPAKFRARPPRLHAKDRLLWRARLKRSPHPRPSGSSRAGRCCRARVSPARGLRSLPPCHQTRQILLAVAGFGAGGRASPAPGCTRYSRSGAPSTHPPTGRPAKEWEFYPDSARGVRFVRGRTSGPPRAGVPSAPVR